MSGVKNIVVCGVGGQGNLAASHLLAQVALKAGYSVKISETHGMAQRGGSVYSTVRYGSKVYSPLIPREKGDYIISMELMEGLRWIHYLNDNGVSIVSTEVRSPYSVIAGEEEYPEGIREMYENLSRPIFIPADKLAVEAGNPKCANVVLLGAYSIFEELENSFWEEAFFNRFKKKIAEINVKAFKLGRDFALKEVKKFDKTT